MALCGQVQINHGGVQTAMSQILLDSADIDAGFEQMCGIRMTQSMDRNPLFELKLFQDATQGSLNRSFVDGSLGRRAFFATSAQAGKDPGWITVQLPVRS